MTEFDHFIGTRPVGDKHAFDLQALSAVGASEFTTGVLIHQPPESLPIVLSEIVRCSKRYVLCGEYFAEEPTELPYRGVSGALFKRNFGQLYLDLFPTLQLIETGTLDRSAGWDDVTWWLFERA